MRQNVHGNVPWYLDGLDPDTRDAAREAARRAGMSLDDWLHATISDRAARAFSENSASVRRRPAPAQPPIQGYDDLDAVASRISRVTRGRGAATQQRAYDAPSRGYDAPHRTAEPPARGGVDAIVAAVGAEAERKARESATRTADALDSVARWIERAEDRMSESTRVLSEGTRVALERQDRTANVLGEALALMTKRLDDIERKVVEGRDPSVGSAIEAMSKIESHLAKLAAGDERRPAATPQAAQVEGALRGFEERIAAIAGKLGKAQAEAGAGRGETSPSDRLHALDALRADVARLTGQLETVRPGRPDATGSASALRRGVDDLASRVSTLATRDDLVALEGNLRELSREAVAAAKAGREADLSRINGLVERVQTEIERIAAEAASGAYGEAGREYRALSERIEELAASDQRQAAGLARELETVRGALAKLADPERLADLQEHIHDLSQRVGHLARNQVTPVDFAGLRSAVEEIRGAVKRSPDDRGAAGADFAAIERQYGSIVERLSGLSSAQPTEELNRLGEAVAAIGERLEAMSASSGRRETELLSRELAAMAAGLADLRDGAKTSDIEAIGDRLDALNARIETFEANRPDHAREFAALRDSLETALAGVRASVPGEIGALKASVERLAQERPDRDIGREFTQLQRGLEMAIADVRSGLPAEFDALKARIDRLAEERPNIDLTPVSEQIARLAERLDEIRSEVRPDFRKAFSELRAGVENAVSDVAKGRSSELEALIQRIDRLDDNVRAIDVRGGVRSLEDMLAQLASRIDAADRPNAGVEAVDALETQIEAIARRLENERDASVAAVAQAARSAVADGLARLPRVNANEVAAGADLDELTRSLSEIKELQSIAQERGVEAVGSVQSTLDKLVERLSSLESRIQSNAQPAARPANPQKRRPQVRPDGAPAAAKSIDAPAAGVDAKPDARRQPSLARAAFGPEMTPARLLDLAKARAGVGAAVSTSLHDEADRPVATVGSLGGDVLLEPGVGRPRASGDAGVDDPAQIKASFIAAARRAAQNAAAEAAAASRRSPAPDLRGGASRTGAAEKSSASAVLAGRRRPLLMAAAAVVLAIGAFQIGPVVTGGGEPVDLAGEPRELADAVMADVSPAPSQTATAALLPEPAPGLAAADGAPLLGQGPTATSSISPELSEPAEPGVIGMDDLLPLAGDPAIGREPGQVGAAPALPPRRTPAAASAPEETSVASAATSAPVRATTTLYPSMVSADELPAEAGPEDLRRAVLAGDVSAVYELASRAAEGRDMNRDPALAAKLFERAAAHGLVPAQFRIGNHYEKGIGVARDFALATLWYQRAAESGNARAMHNLAVLLAEGVNGGPDYAAALGWFRRAAEHGVRDSQYNLAVLLARGLGAEQNLEESYAWFEIAARQGDEDAAAKRDEVASRLDERSLAMARARAESWRPEIPRPEANEVAFPASAADDRSARQAGAPGLAG